MVITFVINNFQNRIDKNQLETEFWTSSELSNFFPLRICCVDHKKWKSNSPTSAVRQYLPAQLINCLHALPCAVRSCVIVLQNNTFSVGNRWVRFNYRLISSVQSQFVQRWALQNEWPPEYSTKHKSGFLGCKSGSFGESQCLLHFGLS